MKRQAHRKHRQISPKPELHPIVAKLADPVTRANLIAIKRGLTTANLLKPRVWIRDTIESYIPLDYGAGGVGIPFINSKAEIDVVRLLECFENGK